MRTTVDIPDVKYKSVKIAAVELNTTVKQVVLEGLDLLLLHRADEPPANWLQLP